MAKPSNTEWRERDRKSMKERKDECAWKSTWTWWPLPSRSFSEWCPWACPLPAGAKRGAVSSFLWRPTVQLITIFPRSRLWRSHMPWWTLQTGSPPGWWGEVALEINRNYRNKLHLTEQFQYSVSSHQGLVFVAHHVCQKGNLGWYLTNRPTGRRRPRSSSQNSARPCGSLETKKNKSKSRYID